MEMRNLCAKPIYSEQRNLVWYLAHPEDSLPLRREKAIESKQDTFQPHTFTFEYPKKAAEAIIDNTEYLEKLIPNLGWQIEIFAGYNILHEKNHAFDSQSRHLLGIARFRAF